MTKNYMELNLKLITPPVLLSTVNGSWSNTLGLVMGGKPLGYHNLFATPNHQGRNWGNLDLSTSWISFYLIS